MAKKMKYIKIYDCFINDIYEIKDQNLVFYIPKPCSDHIEKVCEDYIKKHHDSYLSGDLVNLNIDLSSFGIKNNFSKYALLLEIGEKDEKPIINFESRKNSNKYLIFDIDKVPDNEYELCFYKFIGIVFPKIVNTHLYSYKPGGDIYFLHLAVEISKININKLILLNGMAYFVDNSKDRFSDNEIEIYFKNEIYKEIENYNKLEKQIKFFEKTICQKLKSNKREPIPEIIRFEVWRRDDGKCCNCGSKEKLEYDHIIPISKGGSSTTRNIQLLCESCNREKSDLI